MQKEVLVYRKGQGKPANSTPQDAPPPTYYLFCFLFEIKNVHRHLHPTHLTSRSRNLISKLTLHLPLERVPDPPTKDPSLSHKFPQELHVDFYKLRYVFFLRSSPSSVCERPNLERNFYGMSGSCGGVVQYLGQSASTAVFHHRWRHETLVIPTITSQLLSQLLKL